MVRRLGVTAFVTLLACAPPESRVGGLTRKHEGPVPFVAGCQVTYQGGVVLQNVEIYEVNWTSRVDSTVTSNLGQFYDDIVNSSYVDWLAEYNTAGLNGADGLAGSNQGIGRGTFAGNVTITPTVCASPPCTVTNAQIQQELVHQIGAGALPQPTLGCDGKTGKTLYMVHFPSGVTVTTVHGGVTLTSCQPGSFCAYHDATTWNGIGVPYGVMPFMGSGGGCDVGCGSGGTELDTVTSVASHELMEAITDPHFNWNLVVGRPEAWIDATGSCNAGDGEIGDICNGSTTTVTVNGHSWVVQQEWSNASNACITRKASLAAVCTGPNTPPGCRPCTCADNGFGCVAPSTCGGGGTAGACGTCTPLTNCPAPDNCGSISDGCGGTLSCGTCIAPDTCGGGGATNVCGVATADAGFGPDAGTDSGTPSDAGLAPDAGASQDAGCVPLLVCPAPYNCGSLSDNCGGTLNCGTCTAPETCGGGPEANVCGCTPAVCGSSCGTLNDGCGKTLDCGGCTAGQACTANVCVPVSGQVDAGGQTGRDGGTNPGPAGCGCAAGGSASWLSAIAAFGFVRRRRR